MKIVDDTAAIPRQQTPQGNDRDRGSAHAGFDDVLKFWDGLQASQAQDASAIRPQIGSHGNRFMDRPMVMMTAVEEGSPAAGQSAVSAHLATSDLLGLERPAPVANLAQFIAVLDGWAKAHGFSSEPSGDPRAFPNFALSSTSLETRRFWPIVRGGRAIGIGDSALADRTMPRAVGHTLAGHSMKVPPSADLRANSPPAATPAQSRSMPPVGGRTSPFSAVVIADETGLQLLIRTPALSQADREELELRITEVFSKRGLKLAQIHIRESATISRQGSD